MPQPVTKETSDSADSDCYCSEVPWNRSHDPAHPNTPITPPGRPVAPTPTPRVQFYDHSARFHREYQAEPVVERLSAREVDASWAAQYEREREGAPVQWLQSNTGRVAQRARRGNRALERERVQRDYRQLLDTLGHLSREERLLRSTQTPGPPLDIHQPDERRKARLAVRQSNMDSAFERVFHSTIRPDDTTTTVTSQTESRRASISTTHHHPQEPPTKLNVAQLRQFVAPSLSGRPIERSPTRVEPRDSSPTDDTSPCSSQGSIVVGRLPEGTHVDVAGTEGAAQGPSTLESLMERVNVQRTLLLQEVSRDLRVLGANFAPVSQTAQKRAADRDLSFGSDGGSSCSDREARKTDNDAASFRTLDRNVVWLQEPSRGTDQNLVSEDLTSSRMVSRNVVWSQITNDATVRRHAADINVGGVDPADNRVGGSQIPAKDVAKTISPDKGIERSQVSSSDKAQVEQTHGHSKNLQDIDGNEKKDDEGSQRKEEEDIGKGHTERKASKKARNHKKKKHRVKEATPLDFDQCDSSDVHVNSRKNVGESSFTTVLSEYSMDMTTLSKTEHSSSGFVNGPDSSLGSSSSSTYEGVKIIISVVEKAQRTVRSPRQSPRKERSVSRVPSIEHCSTDDVTPASASKSYSKTSGNEQSEKSKLDGSTAEKKATKGGRDAFKHSVPEHVDSARVQMKTSQSRSPERITSVPKKVSKVQKEGEQKTTHPDISSKGNMRRPPDKEKQDTSIAWREQFKQKSNSSGSTDPSMSTSYNSPPDELSFSRSELVNTLLSTIDRQQEKLDAWKSNLRGRLDTIAGGAQSRLERPVDPKLARYVERLLNMSRDGIDDLSVAVSEVATPSSSIINDSHNLDTVDVDAVDSLLQERVRQIAEELADLEECTSEENDSAFLRLMVKKVQEKARDTAKFKKPTDTAKKSNRVDDVKRGTRADGILPHHKRVPMYKWTPDSSMAETTQDSSTFYDRGVTSRLGPCTKVGTDSSMTETTQDTSAASVIYTRRREFRVPSPIPHENPENDRTDSYGRFRPSQASSAEDQRVAATPPSESRKEQHDPDEHEARKSPEIIQRYEGLTKKCSERINNLSQLIDQVRIEKQRILECSPRSSANANSARSETLESTRYESPPLVVIVPQDVAPPPGVSPKHVAMLSPPYARDSSHSPDLLLESSIRRPAGSKPNRHDSASTSDGTTSTSLVARTVFLTEPADTENQRLPTQTKPPPALWRNILRNDIPHMSAHELSAILEVDQPSRNTTDAIAHEDDATMPDVMAEMLRRRLITSPLMHHASGAEDAADTDASQDSQSFYRSILEHRPPGVPTAGPSDQRHAPSADRSVHPRRGESTSPRLESTTTESHLYDSSNDVDSMAEDLNGVFKKLGLGWAGATLRKTQETKDLSSSSSDLSNVRPGRTPYDPRGGQASAVTSGTLSTSVRASSPDPDMRLRPEHHSTPIRTATDSSNLAENDETTESSGRSRYFSSDPSSVRRPSSDERELPSSGATYTPPKRANMDHVDKNNGSDRPT